MKLSRVEIMYCNSATYTFMYYGMVEPLLITLRNAPTSYDWQ
jgi:hypothetical protein